MKITPELLERYDRPGPRYTSYPTVPAWDEDFSAEEYVRALGVAAQSPEKSIALYVHIPFCEERCWYCGCNVVISKKPEIVADYLDHVETELARVADALGERRLVSQLHWGGGTPTYLTPEQMERLYSAITQHFTIRDEAEVAIEVDPRVTDEAQLETLRKLGFNRISLGVQDLSDDVQKAIGRNQTLEETCTLVDACRDLEFSSLNIDLIYGLPEQTLERWEQTLVHTIELSPDRIAIYSYAHLPELMKHQKHINADALPDRDTKYALMAMARERLEEAGYTSIGMDHFAKNEDEMAIAMREGRLSRNFMGYTTLDADDMVGIGPSAIGRIGGVFNQNEKRLFKYYRDLDEDSLPTTSGIVLTEEDERRSWIIQQLMCNFVVRFADFDARFGGSFTEDYAAELAGLGPFEDNEFLTTDAESIRILPLGQAFIRNIAMVFDAYLDPNKQLFQFSHTV